MKRRLCRRQARHGQLIIVAALIMALLILGTVLGIYQMGLDRQTFAYKSVKEQILALSSDGQRALTHGLSEGSEAYNESFWSGDFLNNTLLQSAAENASEKEVAAFLSNWQRAAITANSPLGMDLDLDSADVLVDWIGDFGQSYADVSMGLNISAYGFNGWRSDLVRSVVLKVDLINSRAWIEFVNRTEGSKKDGTWVENNTYVVLPFAIEDYVGYEQSSPVVGLDVSDITVGMVRSSWNESWTDVAIVNGTWYDSFKYVNGTWFNATLAGSEFLGSNLTIGRTMSADYLGAGNYNMTVGFLNLSQPTLFVGNSTSNVTGFLDLTLEEGQNGTAWLNGTQVLIDNNTIITIANVTVTVDRFEGRMTVVNPDNDIIVGASWRTQVVGEAEAGWRTFMFQSPHELVPIQMYDPNPPWHLITPTSKGTKENMTLYSRPLEGYITLSSVVKSRIFLEKEPKTSTVGWIQVFIGYIYDGEHIVAGSDRVPGDEALTYFEDRSLPLVDPFRRGDRIPAGAVVFVRFEYLFPEHSPGALKISTGVRRASYIDFDP